MKYPCAVTHSQPPPPPPLYLKRILYMFLYGTVRYDISVLRTYFAMLRNAIFTKIFFPTGEKNVCCRNVTKLRNISRNFARDSVENLTFNFPTWEKRWMRVLLSTIPSDSQ